MLSIIIGIVVGSTLVPWRGVPLVIRLSIALVFAAQIALVIGGASDAASFQGTLSLFFRGLLLGAFVTAVPWAIAMWSGICVALLGRRPAGGLSSSSPTVNLSLFLFFGATILSLHPFGMLLEIAGDFTVPAVVPEAGATLVYLAKLLTSATFLSLVLSAPVVAVTFLLDLLLAIGNRVFPGLVDRAIVSAVRPIAIALSLVLCGQVLPAMLDRGAQHLWGERPIFATSGHSPHSGVQAHD